jgi:hypothetical protein
MKVIVASLLFVAVCNASGVLNSKFLGLQTQAGAECDDAGLGTYEVTSFDVKPWPPTRNSNLALAMKGTHHQDVTVVAMDIYVKYNGLDFYTLSQPESGSYKDGQAQDVNFNVYLPSIAPAGKYAVDVKLKDSAGNHLNCWSVSFNL